MKKYISIMSILILSIFIISSLTGCSKEKKYFTATYKLHKLERITNFPLFNYEEELVDKKLSYITFGKYNEIHSSEQVLKGKTEKEKNAKAIGIYNYVCARYDYFNEYGYGYNVIDENSLNSAICNYEYKNGNFIFNNSSEISIGENKIKVVFYGFMIKLYYYGIVDDDLTLLFILDYIKIYDFVVSLNEFSIILENSK